MKLCHHCPDRRPGCHSVCEDYLAYRARVDAEREKRQKEQMVTSVKIESTIKTKNRWRRNYKK